MADSPQVQPLPGLVECGSADPGAAAGAADPGAAAAHPAVLLLLLLLLWQCKMFTSTAI